MIFLPEDADNDEVENYIEFHLIQCRSEAECMEYLEDDYPDYA